MWTKAWPSYPRFLFLRCLTQTSLRYQKATRDPAVTWCGGIWDLERKIYGTSFAYISLLFWPSCLHLELSHFSLAFYDVDRWTTYTDLHDAGWCVWYIGGIFATRDEMEQPGSRVREKIWEEASIHRQSSRSCQVSPLSFITSSHRNVTYYQSWNVFSLIGMQLFEDEG